MTAFFVTNFKKTNKCRACSADKLSGYSLCPNHLKIARDRFMRWANERRGIGRCISCNRKSRLKVRGEGKGELPEIRCSLHARINRLKCARWTALYGKEASQASWKKRKAVIDAGFCACKGHPPLPTGFRRCDKCRTRQKAYGQNQQPAVAS